MSIRWLADACCAFVILVTGAGIIRADELEANRKPSPLKPDAVARRAFQTRDTNGDGKLSEQEFVQAAPEADRPLVKRDFKLLDLNHDGFMSLEEFRNVPYLVPPDERGDMPNPLLQLVEKHFEDSQATWKKLDVDGDGQLDDEEFRLRSAELLLRNARLSSHYGYHFPQLDQDGDGLLSRKEWHRVLEVCYGVRRPQGELLRRPTGTINWMHFRFLDRNRDDRVDHEEFIKFGFDGDLAEKRFAECDTNRDDVLSFDEWSETEIRRIDLFWQFRGLDTNLDARIDRDELMKNIADWQKSTAQYMFPGFDTDQDGFLSLEEFALTPLHAQFIEWHATRIDRDANNSLGFDEFQFDATLSLLGLTVEYFRRLDTNGNGQLDHDEWLFQTPEPPKSRMFVMNADGSQVELLADVGLFDATYLGSPDWSPDGKSLVFDATPPRGLNSDFSQSVIVSLSMSGPNPGTFQKLGFGNCPDWSPDGKKITFFVNGGNPAGDLPGVWIMNADGTERRLLARGLCTPRWAPDGRSVLCCNNFSGPKRYALINVETGRTRRILDNLVGLGVPDWEPGGNSLCVTLQQENGRALCLVDLSGEKDSIIELWKSDLTPEQLRGFYDNSRPNCSQDGREIIFADNSTGKSVLKRVVTTGDEQPVVIAPNLAHIDVNAVWSPDRKRIVFCSTQPPSEITGLKLPTPK